MKKKLKFYKYWFAPITLKQLIPSYSHSKNVQGWFFTRNWSVSWFRYCLLFTITVTSEFSVSRNIAHKKNITRYIVIIGNRTIKFNYY